jgi:hypothetical protein
MTVTKGIFIFTLTTVILALLFMAALWIFLDMTKTLGCI